MQRDAFDALVQRLQHRFERHPLAFRFGVVLWVLAGYLVLLGWLPFLLLVGGVAVFGGAAQLPGSGIWLCIGAVLFAAGLIQTGLLLSIRIEPPKGVFLTHHTAPALFDELDRISEALRCRHFHRVCLTADFNASVARTPRFAWLGWPRTSLTIGWPLFAAMTLPEARAVLAHEFAHLSRDHGRFGHWMYGLHQTWMQLVLQLQSGAQSATVRRLLSLLMWFVDAYWPRLNARLLVLSRAAEYEADRQAVEFTSADALAGALWRINCSDWVLNDRFWPELRQTAGEQSEPFDDFLQRIHRSLAKAGQDEKALHWMEQVCRTLTDPASTHPSFADRVRAMNLTPESFPNQGFPVPPSVSACDELFGRDADRFEQEVCVHWQRINRDEWRRRYGRSAALKRRLTTLEEKISEADIADAQSLWERANAVMEMQGDAAAEPVLRQLVAAHPHYVYGNLLLGQILLERQSLEGVELLQRVIASDQDDVVPQAGDLLAEYFRRTGQSGPLQTLIRHMAAFNEQVLAARKERSSIQAGDAFVPHDLSEADLAPLMTLLESNALVEHAWLAQKAVRYFPHRRMFVLSIEGVRKGWFRNTDQDDQLVRALIPQVRLPGQVLVINAHGSFARIARRVKRVPSALVYERRTIPTA